MACYISTSLFMFLDYGFQFINESCMPNRIKGPHNVTKGNKYSTVKFENRQHGFRQNKSRCTTILVFLLHFYVLFPNFLRRLYSQEFNIGLKHFQLYYQTSSSKYSQNPNTNIGFNTGINFIKRKCLI
jgi:hypothetical protein